MYDKLDVKPAKCHIRSCDQLVYEWSLSYVVWEFPTQVEIYALRINVVWEFPTSGNSWLENICELGIPNVRIYVVWEFLPCVRTCAEIGCGRWGPWLPYMLHPLVQYMAVTCMINYTNYLHHLITFTATSPSSPPSSAIILSYCSCLHPSAYYAFSLPSLMLLFISAHSSIVRQSFTLYYPFESIFVSAQLIMYYPVIIGHTWSL